MEPWIRFSLSLSGGLAIGYVTTALVLKRFGCGPFHSHRWTVEAYAISEPMERNTDEWRSTGYEASAALVCACGERKHVAYPVDKVLMSTKAAALTWVKAQGEFNPNEEALRRAVETTNGR